jgi:excisionase family DNA binding protein
MVTTTQKPLLTSSQAARLIGVSAASLRRWTDEGRLPAIRLPGGARRYERVDVERFQASLRTVGGAR